MTSTLRPPVLGSRSLAHGGADVRPPACRPHPPRDSEASPGPSRLTRARCAAGLTITRLARELHVSRPTVSLWERGDRRPARVYWPALAAALRLEPGDIAVLFVGFPPSRHDGVGLPAMGHLRRRAGLTQREVATRLGVAPTTLSMWEAAGVPVPAALVPQVARLLGTDLSSLRATPPPRPRPDLRPLRGLRVQARMTRKEAAAHLGIAVGSLSRYEAGERVTPLPVVRRMAAAYRVPVDEVLAHSGVELASLPTGSRWNVEDVPTAIVGLRTAAGMSKEALGRLLGRSGQAVRSWEMGQRMPTAPTYRRLEVVFGLPPGRFPS